MIYQHINDLDNALLSPFQFIEKIDAYTSDIQKSQKVTQQLFLSIFGEVEEINQINDLLVSAVTIYPPEIQVRIKSAVLNLFNHISPSPKKLHPRSDFDDKVSLSKRVF